MVQPQSNTQLPTSRHTAVGTFSFFWSSSFHVYLHYQQTLSGPPSGAAIITPTHSALLFLITDDDSKERIISGHLSISLINNDLKLYSLPSLPQTKANKGLRFKSLKHAVCTVLIQGLQPR